MIRCLCCGSQDIEVLKYPERWMHCKNCTHLWKKPDIDEAYYHKQRGRSILTAKELDRKHRHRLDFIRKELANGLRILELGCAEGLFGKYIKGKYNVIYIGVEVSMDALDAQQYLDSVYKGNISTFVEKEPFDLVLAFHVIEHIADPGAILNQLKQLLAIDGLIVIEVPNQSGNPLLSWDFNREHIHFFSVGSLSVLLQRHGFRILKVETSGFESAIYRDSIRVLAGHLLSPQAKESILKEFFHNILRSGCIIFGAGGDFISLLKPFIEPELILAVIDSDPNKWGRKVGDRTVEPPSELRRYRTEKVLLGSHRYEAKLRTILNSFGVRPERIISIANIYGGE